MWVWLNKTISKNHVARKGLTKKDWLDQYRDSGTDKLPYYQYITYGLANLGKYHLRNTILKSALVNISSRRSGSGSYSHSRSSCNSSSCASNCISSLLVDFMSKITNKTLTLNPTNTKRHFFFHCIWLAGGYASTKYTKTHIWIFLATNMDFNADSIYNTDPWKYCRAYKHTVRDMNGKFKNWFINCADSAVKYITIRTYDLFADLIFCVNDTDLSRLFML